MKIYNLKEDVKIFCVTAKSFPDGVKEAWEKLHGMLPTTAGRTFYGISHGDKGSNIIYKAAVKESFEGEGKKYGCETFILKKGDYLTETIIDWMKKIDTIGSTFQTLLKDHLLDENFPCVEWYKSDSELLCMIKIKELKK